MPRTPRPDNAPATAKGTRGPKRSSIRPMKGAEKATPTIRAVCARPKEALLMPNSSPMGVTKSPKLTPAMPTATPPTRPRASTITHP